MLEYLKYNNVLYMGTSKLLIAGKGLLVVGSVILTINVVRPGPFIPNCYGQCRPSTEEYFRYSGNQAILFFVGIMLLVGIFLLTRNVKDQRMKTLSG